MLQRLTSWRQMAALSRQRRRRAHALSYAFGMLRSLKAWKGAGRYRSLLVVGEYVGARNDLRAALRAWKHDHMLERPLDRQWGLEEQHSGAARRAAARAWTVWRLAASAWRGRYQRLGQAYSHWQISRLAHALLHWHNVAQLALDVDLARLLGAQSVGHFDIRLLPTFAQPQPFAQVETVQPHGIPFY